MIDTAMGVGRALLLATTVIASVNLSPAHAQTFTGTDTTNGPFSSGFQEFYETSTFNANAANAASGTSWQTFYNASALNASAADAVSGGFQEFHDTSTFNANAANAASGTSWQTFYNASALNASAADAVSGGFQWFYDTSALDASAAGAVNGGSQYFDKYSELNASATDAVSGGNQDFYQGSALNASAANAISGGTQEFYQISTLNALAANAVSGGDQSFHDDSALDASTANAVSGGRQYFYKYSELNASAIDAISGGEQWFYDSSNLDAWAGAISSGDQYFYGISKLNVWGVNAVSGGTQTFYDDSLLNTVSANSLSGGTQRFYDTSSLNAGASSGVSGGTQRFYDNSALNAAANGVSGGVQYFAATSAFNALAENAVNGGDQYFYDTSTLNASAANAVSGGRQNFTDTSALNALVANAVNGGDQYFYNTSRLDASHADAVSGGNQVFYQGSALNASAANAISGGTQDFFQSSTLNALAANAVSGGDQDFWNFNALNASAANAVSGGTQEFWYTSTLNALAANAVSGGTQWFYDDSTLNASAADAVSGGNQLFVNTSTLNVSATGTISGGTQWFYDDSALNALAANAISSGTQYFFGTSTLNALATNAVSGGSQVFWDAAALNASATDAVSGGSLVFWNDAALNALATSAVGGGTQEFNGNSTLNASVANAISGGDQEFWNDSSLNASAANAISGGTQNFYDTSALNALAANAVNGGFQYFYNTSRLDASAADAVSGGGQYFADTSALNASVANAVNGGDQLFLFSSTLNASAENAISGGTQDFYDASTLNASAANAVSGGVQTFWDFSALNVLADNALTTATDIRFNNGFGGTGGTLRLNGYSTTIGRISSVATGAGVITNGGADDSLLTVDTSAAPSTFSGVIQDGGAGTLALSLAGGNLTLSGANTYTGGTTISGGILAIGNGDALGTGTVFLDGGMLLATGTLTLDNPALVWNAGEIGTIAAASGTTLTLNPTGQYSRQGNASIRFGASGHDGTIVLDAEASTFIATSGSINIALDAGTLRIGGDIATSFFDSSSVSAVDLGAGTILDINDHSIGLTNLTGSGTVTNQGSHAGAFLPSVTVVSHADTTFSGTVTDGSGRLSFSKFGPATLTLSGANSYSGQTAIAGGTLEIAGGLALPDVSTVTLWNAAGTRLLVSTSETIGGLSGGGPNGGIVEIGHGQTLTVGANDGFNIFAGTIIGDGDLMKLGAGTLVLTGANAYGDTLVEAGTLVGDAGSISGDIGNAATAVFDQGTDAGFAGTIVGLGGTDGQMVKRGAGELTLTGTSSLDWTVEAGGLMTGADRFSGNAAIAGGTSLTFDQATAASYAGVLSGAGGFTVSGTGATMLSGDSSAFTGTTLVSEGRLIVGTATGGALGGSMTIGNGGLLGGIGTIGAAGSTVTIAAGGVHAPGNSIGVQHIAGDYVNHGTLRIEATPADADRIVVAGSVDITGATLDLALSPTDAASWNVFNGPYTIIDKQSGGTVVGTFIDPATQNLLFLDALVAYGGGNGNDVTLELQRNDLAFAGVGQTPNQIATGAAVDTLDRSHAVWRSIALTNDQDAVRASFNALSGEIHASAQTALIEDSRFMRNAANDRIRAAFATPGASYAPVLAYGPGDTPLLVSPDHTGPVFWTHGFGSWGSTDSDGNAASLDRSTGGLLIGADTLVGDWRIGLLAGYSHSSFKVNDRSSTASSDNYHLGLYGGTQWGDLAFRTGAVYTWHDIETARAAAIPGIAESLTAGYRADTFQAFGELAYDFDMGATRFEPFANLAHVHLHSDSFTEAGGSAALRGAGGNTDVTFTTLGLRAEHGFTLGTVEATASGMVGWRHAFGDTTPTSTHAFPAGDAFSIAGAPVAKNSAVIEAGLDLNLTPEATFSISYTGQIASGAQDHGFNANLSIKF